MYTHVIGEKNPAEFFEYMFKPREASKMLESVGFKIINVKPVFQPEGLAYDYKFLSYRGKHSIVLNHCGNRVLKLILKLSPWIINHQVFLVAKKCQESINKKCFYFHPSITIWH